MAAAAASETSECALNSTRRRTIGRKRRVARGAGQLLPTVRPCRWRRGIGAHSYSYVARGSSFATTAIEATTSSTRQAVAVCRRSSSCSVCSAAPIGTSDSGKCANHSHDSRKSPPTITQSRASFSEACAKHSRFVSSQMRKGKTRQRRAAHVRGGALARELAQDPLAQRRQQAVELQLRSGLLERRRARGRELLPVLLQHPREDVDIRQRLRQQRPQQRALDCIGDGCGGVIPAAGSRAPRDA